jgi:hypothetical protein
MAINNKHMAGFMRINDTVGSLVKHLGINQKGNENQ